MGVQGIKFCHLATLYNNPPSSDRPVAYAALEDVAESDWDKESSAVVQKEEEEDTELVEDEEGKESSS